MPLFRRIPVTREGVYYLVVLGLILGGAMLQGVNLMVMLAGMLLGPVVLSGWAVVRTLRKLSVERRLPRGICAGDLLVVNVQLTNGRRRLGSWAVAVEDEVRRVASDGAERPLRPSVLFPYVAAGQSRKGAYRGRLPQRGRYRFGPLRVSTRFPFGLLSRTLAFRQADSLIVYPRLGRLTRGWAARHREALSGTHRRERRHGPEGDFYGVREWRAGDSARWIHWRSTARTGKLVVRQFEQPRNRDVAVLVDLWEPSSPGDRDRENVELAVSFAATVLTDVCRKGNSSVHLGTGGRRPDCIGGPASMVLHQDLMERLALAEAHRGDRLGELLEHALGQLDPGTEIVLVSTRPVDADELSRLAAARTDAPRRALVRRIRVVDVSSPQLERYFQPVP